MWLVYPVKSRVMNIRNYLTGRRVIYTFPRIINVSVSHVHVDMIRTIMVNEHLWVICVFYNLFFIIIVKTVVFQSAAKRSIRNREL